MMMLQTSKFSFPFFLLSFHAKVQKDHHQLIHNLFPSGPTSPLLPPSLTHHILSPSLTHPCLWFYTNIMVDDIGDDAIALATRGKHCLNEILSFVILLLFCCYFVVIHFILLFILFIFLHRLFFYIDTDITFFSFVHTI